MKLSSDIFTKEKRSQIMSKVGSKDTKPEKLVRSALHRLGYRFRLHDKKLPGKPDLVLPKYKTVIFVHGCFWHQHSGCGKASIPRTNRAFWQEKLEKNVIRDRKVNVQLTEMGWNVITVWECDVKKHLSEVIGEIDNSLKKRTKAGG